MKIKRIQLIFLLALASCGLTRPLADEGFKITLDEAAMAQKSAYLARPGKRLEQAPNIIWIIVDDLGMGDTDLYGAGSVAIPNISKLADAGTRFSNAYVTSPVCGPSRAAIYTGRYNQRFGFEHQQHDRYLKNKLEYHSFRFFVNTKPWAIQKQDSVPNEDFIKDIGLPESEITIAETLKKYGYQTGLFGKWHLTYERDKGPNAFGFDEFYGFMNSHSLFALEDDSEIVSTRNKKDWTDKYIWNDGRDGLSAIERNGQVIQEDRYLTSAITDEAISFIEKAEDPFFTVLSYNAPHTPFQATREAYAMFEKIDDPVKRTYAAMIYSLDEEIGKLHRYLLATNKLENTLIFFLSDNGGAEYTLATDNGDYKGGKITNFEGGLKVPMFMTWPAKIGTGKKYKKPVLSLDLFKTTLAAVTAEPHPVPLDGTNLTTVVDNEEPAHDYIYFRKGFNHGVRSERYKLTWSTRTGDSLLFDMTTDRFEQVNIYNPDLPEVYNMLRAYNAWQKELISPAWPAMIYYRFKDDDGTEYWFEN
jgi:arylsulfatase A-like enzyme